MANVLIGLVIGVVSVVAVVLFREIGRKMIEDFKAENFATAVIAQNKEAFRRLSEM
jgi:hypothetical protein